MIKAVLKRVGVDKAIAYTSFARVIQGVGGIVSLLFIARYLTGVEQGFYYTFASILAIQVFFELGLGGIITQYVAHENAHLVWDIQQQVEGDPKYISRLASLLRFCLKWYSVLALGLLVVLIGVGFIYFNAFYKVSDPVSWALPWLLLSVGATLNFLIAPITAFLEGLGRIKEIAQYRLWSQLVVMSITWGGLFFGAKLYVGGVASIASALLFVAYVLLSKHAATLRTLLGVHVTDRVHYRKEILPYQWRIALSWVSGYFIFQLFNPVLFATEGAVVAGQMGMTLAVLNSLLALTISWMTTKTPLFSGLIAKRDYQGLDSVFNRTLVQSSVINLGGLLALFCGVFMVRYFHILIGGQYFGDRILPYLPMLFMAIPVFLNHIVSSMAIYLRCHKREPMMVQSMVIGGLCILSTVGLGRLYGVVGMTAGYMVLMIIGCIWTLIIFVTSKEEWHR